MRHDGDIFPVRYYTRVAKFARVRREARAIDNRLRVTFAPPPPATPSRVNHRIDSELSADAPGCVCTTIHAQMHHIYYYAVILIYNVTVIIYNIIIYVTFIHCVRIHLNKYYITIKNYFIFVYIQTSTRDI